MMQGNNTFIQKVKKALTRIIPSDNFLPACLQVRMLKLRSLGAILTLIITIAMPNVGWGASCGSLATTNNVPVPTLQQQRLSYADTCGYGPNLKGLACPQDTQLCATGYVWGGTAASWICVNNFYGDGDITCQSLYEKNRIALAAAASAQSAAAAALAAGRNDLNGSCGSTVGVCLNSTTASSAVEDSNGVSKWTCAKTVNGTPLPVKECSLSGTIFSASTRDGLVLQNSSGSAVITKTGGVTAQDEIRTSGNVTAAGNVSTASGNINTTSGNVSTTSGYVQVGSASDVTCNSSTAGAIRFVPSTYETLLNVTASSGTDNTYTIPARFQGCDGRGWRPLVGGFTRIVAYDSRDTSSRLAVSCKADEIMTYCGATNSVGTRVSGRSYITDHNGLQICSIPNGAPDGAGWYAIAVCVR